ncbi:MAG: hypothetical protein A2V79_05785 [Betaproteobacteria bacterium RBG_16_56_24]|nr:MAG: hypothetical protein A2V79_05785 [Betaproteobacteria bacterium RBG_16_56_24]
MSAEHTAIFKHGPGRQQGAALLIMLVILVIGVAAVLINSLTSSSVKTARQETTAAALAQAKDALIGYAVTYGDTHSGKAHGYLPCPDTDNDGSTDTNQSSAECAALNIPVIGRLPWKSLKLLPLRDGHGECMWYAVSGTFKAVAGGYMNDLMNWDTIGQFTIQDANGTPLSGTTAYDQPVAVIFSGGLPLGTQSHPPSNGQDCSGDNSNSVTAYLDGGNAFSPPALPPVSPIALTAGNPSSTINNDAVLWISSRDIFDHIKKRNDFVTFISSLLNTAITCASQPVTVDFDTMLETSGVTVGSLKIGRIPKACLASPLDSWQDNLLYAICTSANCLTVNSTSCNGVVFFSGERNTLQNRITNTDKNNMGNYLEDTPFANHAAFTAGGTSFSGATSYTTASPTTDILACIP